ncbi:potassium channel family protein [Flavobacteriaceae bacterium]|nr:potassium channel family protein [Flavobacteriaceae bacterium]
MSFFKTPLIRALLLLFSVLLFGVFGFYSIETNYSFFDALYMTVITLSTVGYTEVGPLSEQGRVFAIVFILIGFLIVALAIRFIVEYLISGWSLSVIKQKKNREMINSLNEHTIICGYGRNGRQAVARLKRHQKAYVVIEQDEQLIEENEGEVLFFKGNALSDEVLVATGIKRAKNLISALPNDADNLFVVLSARQLKPEITIISRVSEESNQSKLALAGANHVIMPDKIGGDYMAALLTVPDLIHFLGALDWWPDEISPNVEEVSLSKIPKDYQNKSLAEIQFIKKRVVM